MGLTCQYVSSKKMNVQFGDGKMSGEAGVAEIEGQLGGLIRAQGGSQDVSKKESCSAPSCSFHVFSHAFFW